MVLQGHSISGQCHRVWGVEPKAGDGAGEVSASTPLKLAQINISLPLVGPKVPSLPNDGLSLAPNCSDKCVSFSGCWMLESDN